jgi:ATP-binding cassette subfamily F protein 3
VSVLRLQAIRREIGDFVILDDVSAAVARGERVGLVGPNGAGKTTLLEVVVGREEPESGRVVMAAGTSVGMLSQEANLDPVFSAAPDVRRAVRAGAAEVERLELRLAELEAGGASAVESREYAQTRERFELLDGYHIDQRVDEALSGLGIPREDWGRPVAQLSGGEQTRAALARLLVADPELLLLDEPTNHLDLGALEWLEAALQRRAGALIVASHDRAFLDAVVTRIWELRDRRLTPFRGGYSAYLVQREQADARQRKDAEGAIDAAARERELIQRYRSHRKYAKMHEHERRLEQIVQARVEAPRKLTRLTLPGTSLTGAGPARSGDTVVVVEDVTSGFPAPEAGDAAVPILRVRRVVAARGDRIGIVGPNGAGKTTLLRTISGELPALDGFVRIGAGVQPGYLAQLRGAAIPGTTVLDALLAASPVDMGPARAYLARFLFRGEDVFKPVAELSGGERSRLELALLGITPANLLLLDEPTNHLDIPAREALESFLRDWPGTLLVVSHDRRLLETITARLWVVEPGSGSEPGRAVEFDGGYKAWRAAVAEGWTVGGELERTAHRFGRGAGAGAQSPSSAVAALGRPAPTGSDASADRLRRSAGQPAPTLGGNGRSATRPAISSRAPKLSKDAYRRQSKTVEDDLTRLGLRKSQLELALGDPAVQQNFIELRRLTSELADVDAALAQAEDAWLAIAERAPR